jgi:hypothetical protein
MRSLRSTQGKHKRQFLNMKLKGRYPRGTCQIEGRSNTAKIMGGGGGESLGRQMQMGRPTLSVNISDYGV